MKELYYIPLLLINYLSWGGGLQQPWFGVTNLSPFYLPLVLSLLSPSCTGRHVCGIKMCGAFCPVGPE